MSGRSKNWSSRGLDLQWPLKAACSASAQSSLNELYTKQYKFCPSSHDKEQQSHSHHPHMYRLARKLNRNVIGNSHSVNWFEIVTILIQFPIQLLSYCATNNSHTWVKPRTHWLIISRPPSSSVEVTTSHPKAQTQLAMKSKLYIYLPPTIDDVCLPFPNHRNSSNHSQPQELAYSLTQWMNAHATPCQLPPTIYLWGWWTILGKLHFVTLLSVVKELLI